MGAATTVPVVVDVTDVKVEVATVCVTTFVVDLMDVLVVVESAVAGTGVFVSVDVTSVMCAKDEQKAEALRACRTLRILLLTSLLFVAGLGAPATGVVRTIVERKSKLMNSFIIANY